MTPAAASRRARFFDIRPGERRLFLGSFACFFCLLFGYFILRPIRSDFGISGGFAQLPGLVMTTLVVTLLLNPIFSTLLARIRPRRLIPFVFRFIIANLILFYVALRVWGAEAQWLGRVFFVWLSVVNLFMVSVFWGFMADVFRRDQGKRLFGFIAAGGSLGGIAGSAVVVRFVEPLGTANLILISAVLFEGVAQCVRILTRIAPPPGERGDDERMERDLGDAWRGLGLVVRSSYLRHICGYIILFTLSSSFAYFLMNQQIEIQIARGDERTKIFAYVEMGTNILTLLLQAATGWFIVTFGVTVALVVLPVVYFVGMGSLAPFPTLGLILVFDVLRRAMNYSVAKTGREILYTVVTQEAKYKAKSLIDTFVYRAGDMCAAIAVLVMVKVDAQTWVYAVAAMPVALAWFLMGFHLGRKQSKYRDPRESGNDPSKTPTKEADA